MIKRFGETRRLKNGGHQGLSGIAWVFRGLGLIVLVFCLLLAKSDGEIEPVEVQMADIFGGIPLLIVWIIKGFAKKIGEDQLQSRNGWISWRSATAA